MYVNVLHLSPLWHGRVRLALVIPLGMAKGKGKERMASHSLSCLFVYIFFFYLVVVDYVLINGTTSYFMVSSLDLPGKPTANAIRSNYVIMNSV